MWETWAWSLGWEDPLEEGMKIHSVILAWRIPMDRGAWRAMGSQRVGHNWGTKHSTVQSILYSESSLTLLLSPCILISSDVSGIQQGLWLVGTQISPIPMWVVQLRAPSSFEHDLMKFHPIRAWFSNQSQTPDTSMQTVMLLLDLAAASLLFLYFQLPWCPRTLILIPPLSKTSPGFLLPCRKFFQVERRHRLRFILFPFS